MKNLTINNQPINIIRNGAKVLMPISDIAKIYNREHRKIKRTIENYVSYNDYLRYGQIVRISTKDSMNRDIESYLVNRDIFLKLVFSFRGAKAEKFTDNFIKAFNLLEEEYFKTQNKLINENEKDLALEHTLPFDPKNTISKVNGLKRDKLVRSYYRSKNGKELKALDKAIANLKTSLFGYDEDMLIELIDRRNELIEQRNDFIDLIS